MYKDYIKAYFAKDKGKITDLAERAELAAKEVGIKVPDSSDEIYREQVREYLFENRMYAMEEYWTARILLSQTAESARQSVEATSDKYDQTFAIKIRNFKELPNIRERVETLEATLFGLDEVLIKAVETHFKGSLVDKTKFDRLA